MGEAAWAAIAGFLGAIALAVYGRPRPVSRWSRLIMQAALIAGYGMALMGWGAYVQSGYDLSASPTARTSLAVVVGCVAVAAVVFIALFSDTK